MSGLSIEFGAVDLTNCDQEPIHIPGSIQPHGALIALDPAGLRIVIAGGDTEKLLGVPAMALPGASAGRVLSVEQQARLRDLLASDHPLVRPMYVFTLPAGQQEPTDVIAHVSGGLLVLEYEPRREPHPDYALAVVQGMSRKVQQAGSLQALYDAMATEVRNVIGFDRAMVYRFAADGSGAVVAESRGPGVNSFLGLNFPATDIPRQARALYLANWIRHIPDARYEPVPFTPPLNPLTNSPLDLSQSVLRSVSPVHRQYLANMGVVASMSLSLIPRGQLWGLIACHHHAPRYVSHRLRDVCEIFAEMASSHLEMKLIGVDLEAQLHATRIHEELVTRMSQEADLADGLMRYRPNLLDLIPAEGVGLWVEGRFSSIGITPDPEQIAALVEWLNTTAKEGIFHTDYLPAAYPPAESFAAIASGLLALSVSRSPRDYLLWFRPEMSRTVAWGGNPGKSLEIRPDGARLTPRNSFAAWQESVGMHASPWLAVELQTAHRLHVSLLEVVLLRIDQVAREREAARLQQEKLSRESDRRLEEWRRVAEALNKETERRALVEADLSYITAAASFRRSVGSAPNRGTASAPGRDVRPDRGPSKCARRPIISFFQSTDPGKGPSSIDITIW